MLPLLMVLLVLVVSAHMSANAASITIDSNSFPDDAFRSYISRVADQDENGVLSDQEIADVKTIDVFSNDFTSLKGIEYFYNLEEILLQYGQISTIDITQNRALKTLSIGSNKLSSLDVSGNPALTYLACDYNSIETLDTSHNPLLETLWVECCGLSELDLSQNPMLTVLNIDYNHFSQIDLSHNTRLSRIQCMQNDMVLLDVSHCPAVIQTITSGKRKRGIGSEYDYFYDGHLETFLEFDPFLTIKAGDTISEASTSVPFRKPDLVLPSSLKTIASESFGEIAASVVYIPDSCESIGNYAFRNCPNLVQIRIPSNCRIDPDAFEGCSYIILYSAEDSYAEQYAASHDHCVFAVEQIVSTDGLNKVTEGM